MQHLVFVLKTGVITVIIILLMQIKIDQTNTVEKTLENFMRTSSLTSPLREVAQGGFSFIKSGYHWTSKKINSFFTKNFSSDNSPGARKLTEFKRSIGFEKEEARKKEQEAETNSALNSDLD